MSKYTKSKKAVHNSKVETSDLSSNMTVYEKNYIMTNLLNILFEQVRLQQEVRDRWFGHYLTIIGALAALATLCLKFFENTVEKEILYMILGLMFIFACLLGILFYVLYLCQRRNYKQIYNFLSIIQMEIFKSMSVVSKSYETSTFMAKKHGADFYTLMIQSLIDATMFAVGIIFLSISQIIKLWITGALTTIGFISMFAMLQVLRYYNERRDERQ